MVPSTVRTCFCFDLAIKASDRSRDLMKIDLPSLDLIVHQLPYHTNDMLDSNYRTQHSTMQGIVLKVRKKGEFGGSYPPCPRLWRFP